MKTWKDWATVPEGEAHESLRFAQAMIDAGFELQYSQKDSMYKRTTPEVPPHYGLSFKKGNLYIWSAFEGWQVAELEGGLYSNHRGQTVGQAPYFKDRFPQSKGYIPNLQTVIELEKLGEL